MGKKIKNMCDGLINRLTDRRTVVGLGATTTFRLFALSAKQTPRVCRHKGWNSVDSDEWQGECILAFVQGD